MTAKPLDQFEVAIKAFHDHLDVCRQCEQHPFDLCTVGVPLFLAAGNAAAHDNAASLPFPFPDVMPRSR